MSGSDGVLGTPTVEKLTGLRYEQPHVVLHLLLPGDHTRQFANPAIPDNKKTKRTMSETILKIVSSIES